MTRRAKILWAAAALAAAALAGVLAAHALFDRAGLKSLAIQKAREVWSRELAIGELSLQLRPFPALHATGVTLSNPSWAHAPHLFEAASLSARLELLPLLTGKLAIESIAAEGLRLYLETAPDGRRSWELHGDAGSAADAGKTPFDPHLITSLSLRDSRLERRVGNGAADEWLLDELQVRGQRGWRDLKISGAVRHAGHPLQFSARLDDLSNLGIEGATAEGSAELHWERARLRLAGRLPLAASLAGQALQADLEADSLKGLLGFFGRSVPAIAPLNASAALREENGAMVFSDLKIMLGRHRAGGEAKFIRSGKRPAIEARLAGEKLDWAQFIADLGRPPPPPKPAGELFRTSPLPWGVLEAVGPVDVRLDAKIGELTLRSGARLRNFKARIAAAQQRANIEAFSFNAFGGAVRGGMQLDARRKSVQLDLDAEGVLLGEWLQARGLQDAVSGGPMKIEARVTAGGASMKELAASLAGPVTVRIGAARVQSGRLRQAENLLVGLAPVFAARDAEQVELACAAARLPFSAGRATAQPIAGARSDASQLLASGYVDLRQQTLDLHGKVRARSGISLGMSNLADGVRISGRLLRPEVGLDPESAAAAVARVGAAVLTSGVSLIATAVWDAAVPASDACNAVFAGQAAPPANRADGKRKP